MAGNFENTFCFGGEVTLVFNGGGKREGGDVVDEVDISNFEKCSRIGKDTAYL